jgi:hypothetical protein
MLPAQVHCFSKALINLVAEDEEAADFPPPMQQACIY